MQSKINLVLGLAAVIALAAVMFVTAGKLDTTSAAGGGPEMALTLTSGGACDGDVCQVAEDASFTLSVEAVAIPGPGYILANTYVDFGPDLAYQPTDDAADEMVWPDCESLTLIRGQDNAEVVNHGCLTGLIGPEASLHVGTLTNLAFNCSSTPSSTLVELLPLGDDLAQTSGALYTEFGTNLQITPKVGSLTINCGEAGVDPTPTPTVSPTAGPTGEPTAEPTDGPSPTPTVSPTAGPTDQPTATPDQPCGDINGDGSVESTDALWVLWFTADLIDELEKDGDLNDDGMVDSRDAALILQIVADLYSC